MSIRHFSVYSVRFSVSKSTSSRKLSAPIMVKHTNKTTTDQSYITGNHSYPPMSWYVKIITVKFTHKKAPAFEDLLNFLLCVLSCTWCTSVYCSSVCIGRTVPVCSFSVSKSTSSRKLSAPIMVKHTNKTTTDQSYKTGDHSYPPCSFSYPSGRMEILKLTI
jgi:hypothetical protein